VTHAEREIRTLGSHVAGDRRLVLSGAVRRSYVRGDHEYELDDDRDRVDVDALWGFLSAWRVVAAYDAQGMVGFARAISDGVALAYLADVYVEERARGDGVGVELVSTMIDGGSGAHMRWMLHTRDAHGLYERFGFGRPDDTYLERPSNQLGSRDR
jgi:GNAT superfamily N-acetyltransferase